MFRSLGVFLVLLGIYGLWLGVAHSELGNTWMKLLCGVLFVGLGIMLTVYKRPSE